MPRPKTGYSLRDGTKVPGATDPIGRFKNSGALINWAFTQGKLGRPSLYAHLEGEANVGTCVHDMADLALDGKSDDEIAQFAQRALPDPVHFGRAMAGFRAYQEWERAFKVRVVDRELSIVSEKWRLGMTLDRVAVVGNELALLEFKTASGIYADFVLQVAAYKRLYEERFPERKLVGGAHIIRLPKDGTSFEHRHYDARRLRKAWQLFRLYRRAFDLDKEISDRTFLAGAPITAAKPARPRRTKVYPTIAPGPSYAVTVGAVGFNMEGKA